MIYLAMLCGILLALVADLLGLIPWQRETTSNNSGGFAIPVYMDMPDVELPTQTNTLPLDVPDVVPVVPTEPAKSGRAIPTAAANDVGGGQKTNVPPNRIKP